MAEKKQTAAQTVEQPVAEVIEQPAETDPWKVKKTILLPRARAGEQKHVLVGVNGQQWQVPRGKPVEVPEPIYERLMIMLEGEMAAQAYMEQIPSESAPDMSLKRVR